MIRPGRDRNSGSRTIRCQSGEAGATLILAIIFLNVVGLIVISIVTLAGNNLSNTAHFRAAHDVESAANDANQIAVQYVRYNFMTQTLDTGASAPAPCWTTGTTPSTVTTQGHTVAAWCSTHWTYGEQPSRVVTISTCPSSVASGATCAANPFLKTIASFTDVLQSGIDNCIPRSVVVAASATGCGRIFSEKSWIFSH